MHGGTAVTENQEEEKSPLNKIKSDDTLKINKGVELLLRNKRRIPPPDPKTFQVKFSKMVSLLKREIHINLDFSLDIIKHNPRGKR